MWAIALQLLSVWVGWQVIRLLPITWRRLEAAAASVAVGMSVSAWTYFVICGLAGFPIGLALTTLLLAAGSLASFRLIKQRAVITSAPYGTRLRWLSWTAGAAIGLLISYVVIISYQFPASTGAWISNGNVWGDSPLHVGLTTQFAHGNKLDLVSPIYKHVTLTYPLMADLWSGILMRFTSSWLIGLMLPSLVMMLALLQLVFSFGYRLLGSAVGAWLQFLMLVFSGSLRGGWMLSKILFLQGITAYNAAVGTSIAFATGDNYLNFLNSHPLPQRSYLFGMPLLIVVLSVALSLYRDSRHQPLKRHTLSTAVTAGVLGGLLPLVHTHSFMVLAGILTLATAGFIVTKSRLPGHWWTMLAVMFAVAAPQVFWQFKSTYTSHFSHWIWGWMMQNFVPLTHANWFSYWFINVGFLFIMILFGWVWLWRAKVKPEVWLAYVAGVIIFLICNVYVFQPSQWDNMKFFEYGFWLIMLSIAAVMTRWVKTYAGAFITGVLMITLCTMGFYTLVLSTPKLSFELLSASDVTFGEHMQTRLPKDAYLLVGDRHNHPITMLSDRKVLMTFSGWYNLYGADWPTTLADRGTMLGGEPGAPELIKHYGLTHAAFSDAEVYSGEANLSFYQQHYALFDRESGWWVFDLRTYHTAAPTSATRIIQ